MTKKDYVKFAQLFAGELVLAYESKREDRRLAVKAIMFSTADIFAHDSPKFDRQRFYAACESKKD